MSKQHPSQTLYILMIMSQNGFDIKVRNNIKLAPITHNIGMLCGNSLTPHTYWV